MSEDILLVLDSTNDDSNEKILLKILAITALSLNLLQAKATLSIDGYMSKMLFMKVKDGGTVYGQV